MLRWFPVVALGVSGFVCLGLALLLPQFLPGQAHWPYYAGQVFLGGVFWAAFGLAKQSLKGRPQALVNAVLGGTMLKLFGAMILTFVIIYTGSVNAYWFIGSFFSTYFLLAGLEVKTLLSNLRPDSQPGANHAHESSPPPHV